MIAVPTSTIWLDLQWTPALRELSNHLWQTTVFAAVLSLAALAMRRHPARIRHALWVAASLKFLVPFSLLIALGTHLSSPTRHAAPHAAPRVAFDAIRPFAGPTVLASSAPAPVRHRAIPVATALLALWIAGIAAVSACWLIHWLRIAAVAGAAKPILEGREVRTLRGLELAAGTFRTPLAILASSSEPGCRVLEPGVFGLLHPVLLWPAGISSQLDDAHLTAVLAHELSHVRRRDNITSALHILTATVFWFHPLVWFIARRLVHERERACDEHVLALRTSPEIYAESILRICELTLESPLPCVAGISGADLRKRIAHIMNAATVVHPGPAAKLTLTGLALATVTLPILLGESLGPKPVEPAQAGSQSAIKPAQPMARDADPAFEVASIHPSDPNNGREGFEIREGRVMVENKTVRDLITFAYRIHARQIVDAPAWISTSRFDIAGVLDVEGYPNFVQYQRIVQRLLAERFGLKFHRDRQELAVYTLTVAKGGPRLKASTTPDGLPDDSVNRNHGWVSGTYTNQSMDGFSHALEFYLDRPIVNQTNLTGSYTFTLSWTQDNAPPSLDPNAPPGIFTAIQEQAGLRMEPSKALAEVLVIDHIDSPSAN